LLLAAHRAGDVSILAGALKFALVWVLLVVEVAVFAYAVDRFDFRPAAREPDTWHGRPVSQADRDVTGPRYRVVLYVVALLVILSANVALLEFLL
jgi:hypothetical protein